MPGPAYRAEFRATLKGPFFDKDPKATLRVNIRELLARVADEAASDVQAQITAKAGAMPRYTGWSRDHVKGYVKSSRTGRPWALWAAVGSPTTGMDAKTSIRTKAALATIERRFRPFARTKRAIYGMRAILAANLTKGLE